jgi:hypothetical protein
VQIKDAVNRKYYRRLIDRVIRQLTHKVTTSAARCWP